MKNDILIVVRTIKSAANFACSYQGDLKDRAALMGGYLGDALINGVDARPLEGEAREVLEALLEALGRHPCIGQDNPPPSTGEE